MQGKSHMKTEVAMHTRDLSCRVTRLARCGGTTRAPVLNVSIPRSKVERDEVLALLCELGRAHADEEFLWINVLDNARAAKRYVFGGEGSDSETNIALRANYVFFRGKAGGSQSVDWFPDTNDPDRRIHIDLGEPPPKPSATR